MTIAMIPMPIAARVAPTLAVEGLSIDYGPVQAVRNVSLAIAPGEAYGLIGESGSGKSTVAYAVMGYLNSGRVSGGRVVLNGADVFAMGERGLEAVRGPVVSMVFQDPMNALTPHLTIGRQLSEVVLERGLLEAAEARARCLEALRSVRMPDPDARLRQYPHELSGGQRQRAAIAMALMTQPDLVIADEPTTALDVTVQAQVLDVLRDARDRGLALVLITHDLGVVAGIADRVAVMYAGRIVECAPVRELFAAPAHPYTAALLASVPRLDAPLTGRLEGIEGQPPQPGEEPQGCSFAPRCPSVVAQCRTQRPALQAAGERSVACHAPLARPGAQS